MSDALRTYRSAANLSQGEIADRLGVRKSTICKWESRRIPAERVIQVEQVTGIPRHKLRPDLYPAKARAAS